MPTIATLADTAPWFWAQTEMRGDCLVWTGATDRDGYGMFKVREVDGYRYQRAHRLAFLLSRGEHPGDLLVCHRCDNPPCVLPEDLFLGTVADNNADMVAKGRERYPVGDEHWSHRRPDRVKRGDGHYSHIRPETVRRGEASPRARLTQEQVDAMRDAYGLGGVTFKQLGALYGVTTQHAHAVVRGRFWRSAP